MSAPTIDAPAAPEPGITTIRVGTDYLAIVDADDYAYVAVYNWRPLFGSSGKIYAHARRGDSTIYMHRLIASTATGYETDHINGNGLDNRRSNLRAATSSQNKANRWKPRRSDGRPHSSQFKGVSWDKARRKWQSKIRIANRTTSLGRYVNEADAARAYDVAALATWGEFAWLNLPSEVGK